MANILEDILAQGPQGGGIQAPVGSPTGTPSPLGPGPGGTGPTAGGPTPTGDIVDIDGIPTPKVMNEIESYMKKGYKSYIEQNTGELRFENANGQVVGRYPKGTQGIQTLIKSRTGLDWDAYGSTPRTFTANPDGTFSERQGPSTGAPSAPAAPSVGGGGSLGGGGGATRSTGGGISQPGSVGGAPNLPPIGGAGGGETGGPLEIGNIADPGRRTGPSSGVPASLFDFLPANFNQLGPEERMAAIIGAVTRRQEAGLETSLGRLDSANAERVSRGAGVRALEDRILGDTDVMSEADIQRISGAATQRANQGADVLGRALAERRAAAGSSRSGGAQTEQSAVLQNALGTAIQAESDLRAGARRENFASRNAALQGVGQSVRADVGLGAGIQGQAAGAIEGSQVFGDAFLTQNLLNRGGGATKPVYQTTQAGGVTTRDRIY